jgi:hypothetical protein
VSDGPVRNPKRYFGDNYTGSVNISRDSHKPVPFESLLEQDWLVRTDAFSPDLRSIKAQPFEIEYRFDGRTRIWIPDFLRRRKDPEGHQDPAPDLVEVKPLISVYPDDPDEAIREQEAAYFKAKFDAIRMQTLALGYEFVLATENEIRIEPSLQNASLMRGCADRHFPGKWEKIGEQALLSLPRSSSIRELERVLPKDVDAFSVALRLAWKGDSIVLDPSDKWTRATKFARV